MTERFRPSMKSHNELLARIASLVESAKARERQISELENKLSSLNKRLKPNRFISPRLIRLVKTANRSSF